MPRATGPTLLAAGGLLFAAFFFGGRGGDGAMPFVGGAAAVLGCGLLVWLRPGLTRAGRAAAVLACGFVAWLGLSVLWSAQPDRSWDYLNRGLVYLAFGAVGVALGSIVSRRAVAEGLAALLGLVAAWALLGKVVPALGPEARIARLRSPVGIWNELALLGDMALPLALWLATRARRRLLGTLLLYLWLVALALTVSRGGVAVAVVVVAGWLLLADPKLESTLALLAAGVPAAAVTGVAFALSGVTSDGAAHGERVTDGRLFGTALVVGAVLAAGLTVLAGKLALPAERRRVLGRATAALTSAVVLAAAVVASTHASSWWDEFRNPAQLELPNTGGRFLSASSNNRWLWWTESWAGWRDEPVLGNGAGTFELVHLRLRDTEQAVTEPHDLPLQLLVETGIVGLLLFAGAAGAALAAGFGRARENVALWLVLPAYLLHALLEIDWDFLAVSAPAFLVAGVLLARPGRLRLGTLAAAVAAAAAAAVLFSLWSPWLADRAVDRAYEAASPAGAVREARLARALNPLSIEPLRVWSSAELERGNRVEAYRRALAEVELQPDNPAALCDVGQLELALDLPFRAYEHLNRWYTLDSQGPCLDLLDQARDRVNAGG